MSHIKAWYEVDVCTRTSAGNICEESDGQFTGCEHHECERHGNVISDYCKYVRHEERFIERDYKRVSAEPHDYIWDGCYGYWNLDVGRTCYVCSFLEIDGRVVCDQRKD